MALYTTPEFTRYAAVHQNPNGEGDARPTALQVINDNGLKGKLTDKTILITGCSSGLGVETARALAATGAHIFCTARSLEKGQAALADILSPGKVDLLHLDLESLASVRTFAAEFLAASHGKLDILINNAGVMAIPQSTTADGFETQFGVNHLAHFLLFQLLKPALVASSTPTSASRVVAVSSMGHRYFAPTLSDIQLREPGAYDPNRAYAHSKTGNIWFANYIDRHYGSSTTHPIHALSLHPGGIWTGLQDHLPEMDAMKEIPAVQKYMKSPAQGAATTVWATVGECWEGKGGVYLDDCQVCPPVPQPSYEFLDRGYEKWAYDVESEEKLWEMSNELVGFQEA
jgi:NAD(P)-dependent dehydrogenase (short-subunit alcohol dehydrogenase family)